MIDQNNTHLNPMIRNESNDQIFIVMYEYLPELYRSLYHV